MIPEAPVVTQASPMVLKEVPVSPSISMLFAPADDLEDTKSAAIEVDVTPSQTPIDSEASTPHAQAPERRRTFTVPGHSAAFRGHRSSIIFRAPPSEVVAEAEKVLVNLKTAFESKMSQAIVGVLHGLASSIYGSAEKQRAYFVVDAAANIIPVFSESVDNAAICEKCLIVIALLCRHTDDSKTSICLENVKAFGTGGAPEAILASIQKHGGDAKVLEATCDAVRSLCCLESNRFAVGYICSIYISLSNTSDFC